MTRWMMILAAMLVSASMFVCSCDQPQPAGGQVSGPVDQTGGSATSQPGGGESAIVIARNSLSVSSDAKLASFVVLRQRSDDSVPPERIAMLMDASGKCQEIQAMLPRTAGVETVVDDARISPDGAYLLVEASCGESGALYLVRLGDGVVQFIVDGKENVEAVWAGDNVVYSTVTKGKVDRIRTFAASMRQAAARELPIRGMVVAGSAKSGRMIVGADPKSPDNALDGDSFKELASALLVDSDGKVLNDIVPVKSASPQMAISADGKTISYMYVDAENMSTVIGVVSDDGKVLFAVEIGMRVARPVAVLNSGILIASDQNPLEIKDGVRIVQMDAQQNVEIVAENVSDATVVGETLYTISNPAKPVLKSVKLSVKVPPKAATGPATSVPAPASAPAK